jgi:hypothetical protein
MCDNPPLPVATATCAIYSTVSRSIIHRFQSYQGLCAPENLTVSMMPLPHIQYGPIPLPGVNCPLPQPLTTATRGYPTVSQSIHHQFHSFEALCTPHVPTASMTQLPPNKNTPLSVFTTTATASCHCHCQFLLTSPRKAATAPSLHPHPLKIATSWPPQQCMQSEYHIGIVTARCQWLRGSELPQDEPQRPGVAGGAHVGGVQQGLGGGVPAGVAVWQWWQWIQWSVAVILVVVWPKSGHY